jgi:hypothetical protein
MLLVDSRMLTSCQNCQICTSPSVHPRLHESSRRDQCRQRRLIKPALAHPLVELSACTLLSSSGLQSAHTAKKTAIPELSQDLVSSNACNRSDDITNSESCLLVQVQQIHNTSSLHINLERQAVLMTLLNSLAADKVEKGGPRDGRTSLPQTS